MSVGTHAKPLSLAELFNPPEGYVGYFGWVCGYSADAAFMDDALQRFSFQSRAQRAHGGRTYIGLLLDRGNSQLCPTEVPGLLHLPSRPELPPFVMLHAKIGLLAFRHEQDVEQWAVRLIVSTGNWTRQTVEESLDLAFRTQIYGNQMKGPAAQEARSDIAAAWGLMRWLLPSFDDRALRNARGDESLTPSQLARMQAEKWFDRLMEGSRASAHFIDNRRSALLDQLVSRVRETAGGGARNFLAMGSGYFESTEASAGETIGKAAPSVLNEIVQRLQDADLLTRQPTVHLYVNPDACQAVADASRIGLPDRWSVRLPAVPAFFGAQNRRFLHAKFLLGANSRANSIRCLNPWVYLGSGNLSRPGFARQASRSGGNLEAGVVIAPGDLTWDNYGPPGRRVGDFLPIALEGEETVPADSLHAGCDMPDRDDVFVSGPIAVLRWIPSDSGGWLATDEQVESSFAVLNGDGQKLPPDESGRVRWTDERPRQVKIVWRADGIDREGVVPVIDEFGRLAGAALLPVDIDGAWSELESFPAAPSDESLSSDSETGGAAEMIGNRGGPRNASDGTYPIRRMMQLLEMIALRQTGLAERDWAAWCQHLEQALCRTAGSPEVSAFIESMQMHPLGPLWKASFRPAFAEDATSEAGQRYEAALRRITAAWKVDSLPRLGEET